jgi:ADP-ribose pyrophosphatase YjhB (NUDIX family)
MTLPIRALVTAGGTREFIDDVRVITNLSTGRFGTALASALCDLGIETTLLGNHSLTQKHDRGELDKRLEFVSFDTFLDLQNQLAELAGSFDLVLMAAAVSDYSPVRQSGKMSSSSKTVAIPMTRNPKILTALRAWYGADAVLVGFKLLSGVSREHLVTIAREQIEGAKLDFTVANELSELGGPSHPVMLVTSDCETRLEGSRDDVAGKIAGALSRHCRIHHRLSTAPIDWADELQLNNDEDALLVQRGTDRAPYRMLFDCLPDLTALVVSPWPVALTELSAPDLSWPAIEKALAQSSQRRRFMGRDFAIRLPGQRSLFGFSKGFQSIGKEAADEFPERLKALPKRPIISKGRAIGFVFWDHSRQAGSPWILPALRTRGYGDQLVEELQRRRWPVVIPDTNEELFNYYLARGYIPASQSDGHRVLNAASSQTKIRIAGSICLYNPITRMVLLGRRLTEPWRGYWAFPGGNAEDGETALEGARRELTEETGIKAPDREPYSTRTVYVASSVNNKFYRVTNYQFLTLECPAPVLSEELEGRWLGFEDAVKLKPMAAGTRRILAHVLEVFG